MDDSSARFLAAASVSKNFFGALVLEMLGECAGKPFGKTPHGRVVLSARPAEQCDHGHALTADSHRDADAAAEIGLAGQVLASKERLAGQVRHPHRAAL